MILALVGSAAIGLVWGWLLGRYPGSSQRPVLTYTALTLASVCLVVAVVSFATWYGMIAFFAGLFWAASVHIGWRRALRRRSGQTSSQ
jgi:hypothetical protein